MFVHLADAVQKGHTEVMIRSVDTDVVVLAIYVIPEVPTLKELWVHVGKGQNRRYIAAHEIYISLGPTYARILPAFHNLSGVDNNSSINTLGKPSWWKALRLRPQALVALQKLAEGDVKGAVKELQLLLITAISPKVECTTLTDCRRIIYTKSDKSTECIPPTEDAFYQYLFRTSYLTQVCAQLTKRMQDLPSPLLFGWKLEDGQIKMVYRTKELAAEACKAIIVRCNCNVACKGNCSCTVANVKCIPDLCGCKCSDE